MVLFLGWASRSVAQPVGVPDGVVTTAYGESIYAIEPYGGFGMETIQTPFVGAFWLDRFGMIHATEPAELLLPAVA
jgi:hypothetical protein